MVRFDGYSATTTAANHQQLAALFGSDFSVQQGKGFHGFGNKLAFKDATGSEVGSVSWGGKQADRSMIEVKGEHSPRVVEGLRSAFPHRATRLDSCADFDAPGSFDSLLGHVLEVKKKHRLIGDRKGDWEDFPERGRTQYVGSTGSVSMLRLYEKGRQPEYRHLGRPDWVRAEVQVRPAKEAKTRFSTLSPAEVWGASRWTRDLAALILQDHIDAHPAGTTWRKTSLEKRLEWVCTQAGPTLLELLGELGSWECVGLTIGEKIKELRNAR
jgi:DNA relaxase NicK